MMKQSGSLGGVPVMAEQRVAPRHLHRNRRLLQGATIVLAILVPLSGLFRIDPVDGAFVVLDRQIWFSDFFIVVGLWLALSCALVMTYSLVGTAFCGWVCPQNTLSEWANLVTHKWLGRRADVSLEGQRMQVSRGKDKVLNWLVLGAMFIAVSLLAALIPLLYFYPADVIWSFVSFRDDARLAPSLYWIYTIFVLIVLLDVAFIRHFWCRFMCIYKVWQHSFKTRQTLRIAYDSSQGEECARCNFCVTACFIGIDPRQTETYDSCINCGECINACRQVRSARGSGDSLLGFELGHDQRVADRQSFINIGSLLGRARWASLLAAGGLVMFGWGLWHYQPYHLTVYRADVAQGNQMLEYRINVANKRYHPADLQVEIDGLAAADYRLDHNTLHFATTGRSDLALHLNNTLPKGLYRFHVRIKAHDGWQDSFQVQHYVAGGQV
ncbi:MAG: 4Fe-4S binding protein [Gammaproteobacteria bacterium]|nr:4Fe-4S binding protein [Gammaproteobacteria bacterium]